MIKKILFCLLFVAINYSVSGQRRYHLLHTPSMRLFISEKTGIIVYDVNKETLLKSFNNGARYMSLSADNRKVFTVNTTYAAIIDIASLDLKEIKFDIVNNEKPDHVYPLGVSDNGIAVIRYVFGKRIECVMYDITKAGHKVNTIKVDSSSVVDFDGKNIFVLNQDGIINKIDPISGKLIKKIPGAIDSADLAEAKQIQIPDYSKSHLLIECVNRNIIHAQLVLQDTNSTKIKMFFDLSSNSIIHKQRIKTKDQTESLSNLDAGQDLMFIKRIPKSPKPVLELPKQPDYEKMKLKKIELAQREYQMKLDSTSVAWRNAMNAYGSYDNIITRIYSDFECTQEIFSVEGAKDIFKQDDYLIVTKEISIEIYDIKTKKLLHSIYKV